MKSNVSNNLSSYLLVFQVSTKMMDALSVVTQLRDLASEPQNREAIVQDQGCLPGLVLFLDHKDSNVLFATLQVHSDLICQCTKNVLCLLKRTYCVFFFFNFQLSLVFNIAAKSTLKRVILYISKHRL